MMLAGLVLVALLSADPPCTYVTAVWMHKEVIEVDPVPYASATCEGTFSVDQDRYVTIKTPHHRVVFRLPASFTDGWLTYHWLHASVELYEEAQTQNLPVTIFLAEEI